MVTLREGIALCPQHHFSGMKKIDRDGEWQPPFDSTNIRSQVVTAHRGYHVPRLDAGRTNDESYARQALKMSSGLRGPEPGAGFKRQDQPSNGSNFNLDPAGRIGTDAAYGPSRPDRANTLDASAPRKGPVPLQEVKRGETQRAGDTGACTQRGSQHQGVGAGVLSGGCSTGEASSVATAISSVSTGESRPHPLALTLSTLLQHHVNYVSNEEVEALLDLKREDCFAKESRQQKLTELVSEVGTIQSKVFDPGYNNATIACLFQRVSRDIYQLKRGQAYEMCSRGGVGSLSTLHSEIPASTEFSEAGGVANLPQTTEFDRSSFRS